MSTRLNRSPRIPQYLIDILVYLCDPREIPCFEPCNRWLFQGQVMHDHVNFLVQLGLQTEDKNTLSHLCEICEDCDMRYIFFDFFENQVSAL